MNLKKTFLLWLSFFLTTSLVFGIIAIPSYIYWFDDKPLSFAAGGIMAFLFGVIYSSYKLKTLNFIEIKLDFPAETDSRTVKKWMEKEMLRLGYRPQGDGELFLAGFRADYYMSPDITASYDNLSVNVTGPAFYLKKLNRRFKKFLKKSKKKQVSVV